MAINITKSDKTALLFLGSGAVEEHLLDFLLLSNSYSEVLIFGSEQGEVEHPKLTQYILEKDKIEELAPLIKGDDLYLCLNASTDEHSINAHAYEIADYAAQNGVNQLMFLSSVGADEDSVIPFFRFRGELEERLKKLSFWSLHIFRPSFLLDERPENRWGEQLARLLGVALDRITSGAISKYKPIEADVVAKAMLNAGQSVKPGIFIYPSPYLQKLANEVDQALGY